MYTVSMIPFPDSGFCALVLSKLVQCNMTKIMSLPKKWKRGNNLLFCLCFEFVTRLWSCPLYIYPCVALYVSHGLQGMIHLFTRSCVKLARIRSSFCWSRQNILQGWIQDFSCTTKEWHNWVVTWHAKLPFLTCGLRIA